MTISKSSIIKNFFAVIFTFIAAFCFAQRPISGPLSQNVWFDALGSREGQGWGFDFMTVLPAIPGIAQHPMAISENGGAKAAYILNRFPYDSARIYTFPGGMVVPGKISGSSYTDFVCWDPPDERITVLFGTSIDSVFDTALVLQGQGDLGEFEAVSIVVDNFDSTNVQGFVIGDPSFEDSAGYTIGRMLYYKGGNVLNQTPAEEVVGIKNQRVFGANLMSGKLRDPYHKYLTTTLLKNYLQVDSLLFLLYPYEQILQY